MGIKLLDRDTIEKITAGEVVERPLSVVKELVENSIDAGATGITVEIREGGLEYIRVTDNGCGIAPGEVKLAFQSHATSKLIDAQGLTDIRTMGFRGEALPSIAAVSKVTLTTKPRNEAAGVRLRIEGGNVLGIDQTGCPDGTTITVSELFYNVPVRKTFMKKAAYEQSLVSELMQKFAVGNPGISFRFISSGKTLLQTGGDGNLMHAALAVFGSDYAAGLREINELEGAFGIRGYIGVSDQAAPTRAKQYFYLNGRLINCRILSQALEEACRGRVTIGKFPSCALFLTAPTSGVDINVHPSKLEVRFRDEAAFRLTAQSLLKRCFVLEHMMDAVLPVRDQREEKKEIAFSPAQEKKAEPKPSRTGFEYLHDLGSELPSSPNKQQSIHESRIGFLQTERPLVPQAPEKIPVSTGKVNTEKADTDRNPEVQSARTVSEKSQVKTESSDNSGYAYRLIGTYLNTYILLEYNESLILIDQHAAHERLNFEQYTKRLDEGVLSQQLLVPVILEVTPREAQILEDSTELLAEAGYSIELFGQKSVKVTAVPFIYGSSDLKILFTEMIDSLDLLKRAEKQRRLDAVIQASCKHAVKAGDKLTDLEIRALLEHMAESVSAPTCPHGRPVMKVFSKRSIEQLFKRIQ